MTLLKSRVHAPSRLSTAQLATSLEVGDDLNEAGEVDFGRIRIVASQLQDLKRRGSLQEMTWNDPRFWNTDGDQARRSQFFTMGNSINFRFWCVRGSGIEPAGGTIDGIHHNGALYMWRALRRSLDRLGDTLLDASYLAELSDQAFDEIFADDSGLNPLAVGREDRIANLRDLGRRLIDFWDGQFINVVQATNGSLLEFARLSQEFRAFDDPLFKLTMLNAIVHSGSQIYSFDDQPLPAIDYHLLKQAVRLGIVRPSAPFAHKLERQEVLAASEALALRRLAMTAFVAIARTVGVSGEIVDNLFWTNRTNCTDPEPVCMDPATACLCPLLDACLRLTQFQRPLELTRYY